MKFEQFYIKALAATQAVRKARPDPANNRHRKMPAQPTMVNRDTAPVHKATDWFENLTEKEQEAYRAKHPKSRKKRTGGKQDTHHVPHVTPKEGPAQKKFKIVWPKNSSDPDPEDPDYLKKIAANKAGDEKRKAELDHDEAQAKKRKDMPTSKREPNYDKGMAFFMRVAKLKPDKKANAGLDPKEKAKLAKEYKEFEQTYGKMDTNDISDAADEYYKANQGDAIEDRVDHQFDPDDFHDNGPEGDDIDDGEADDIDEDNMEAARDKAENSDEAEKPELAAKEEAAYNKNPLYKMPYNFIKHRIGKSVRNMAKYYKADDNKIISHTYQFLNKDQLEALDQVANDALRHNMEERRKVNLPESRKRLLTIIGVTTLTAAGIAFGGPVVGLHMFNESTAVAGKEGQFHTLIWNTLRGKRADGSDDPDFDPHEDAVEKIVKGLKRQLADIDDESQRENLEDIIDKLDGSTERHRDIKDAPLATMAKPKAKVKVKKKSKKKK
jgi:hypothetical protein